MATVSIDRTVDQLNSLLRGEISAVETYDIAIGKVDDEHGAEATMLRAIAQEHGQHAQTLRDEIRRLGSQPDDSSGAWGLWAKTVQGAASLFGDASALKALKEGEEHGIKDYREAFDDIDAPTRELVLTRVLPDEQRHVEILDGMMRKIERMGD